MNRIFNILRCGLPLCLAAACLAAGGCGKKAVPRSSPVETATRWWRSAASGDAEAAAACLSGDTARKKSAAVLAECVRIRAAAGRDRQAGRMLKRLEGIRVGEVRSGPVMAVVPLVHADGKPFLEVTLELPGSQWVITDIR